MTHADAAANSAPADRGPWRWIPSLYFAEGVPYVVVMTAAVIMYKRLGVSNRDIAWFTSVLYLPWVVKPLWSMIVEGLGTRRRWTVAMQTLVAAGFAATALALNMGDFFRYSLATLAFVAFMSATHDVAADGFYLDALDGHQQAWFVGIRSTFYRLAMIVGQGVLVMLAGLIETSSGLPLERARVEISDAEPTRLVDDWANWAPDESDDGPQRILVRNESFTLALTGRPPAETKQLIDAAREWNVAHAFHPAPEAPATPTPGEKPGWIARLESLIRDRFGPPQRQRRADADQRAGDLTAIMMRVSKPVEPGSNLVVQFDRAEGDPSFAVVEGERFVVTADNWRRPFVAIVQADAKLDAPSSATFELRSGDVRLSWTIVFYALAGLFCLASVYHALALPRPPGDKPHGDSIVSLAGLAEPLVSYFRKPGIVPMLAFLLLYRFAESQLVKIASPFLLDSRDAGGLALTTGEVGFVYGTVGVVMLSLGGIVGGIVAARHGLKRWLWWMVLAINLPNLAYVVLSCFQPESFLAVNAAVAVEQFGYGFGFTAYMLYCMYVARGEHKTVHYALCTGAMALGMMLPGMVSGWLQELLGYERFFLWIMIATIPSFAATAFIPLDADFGRDGGA
ncbi:MAG: hypothetical protein KF688_10675 [Pirellulales bacterium]|nr:hypothetical protein [Pirellulales bacterium]